MRLHTGADAHHKIILGDLKPHQHCTSSSVGCSINWAIRATSPTSPLTLLTVEMNSICCKVICCIYDLPLMPHVSVDDHIIMLLEGSTVIGANIVRMCRILQKSHWLVTVVIDSDLNELKLQRRHWLVTVVIEWLTQIWINWSCREGFGWSL